MAKRGRDLTWTVCRETNVNYPTVSYREIAVFCIRRVGKMQITIALRGLSGLGARKRQKRRDLEVGAKKGDRPFCPLAPGWSAFTQEIGALGQNGQSPFFARWAPAKAGVQAEARATRTGCFS
jgi:hypothetical protein